MNKKTFTITLILLITLIGCTQTTTEKTAQTISTQYRTGTQGLDISFVQNMPPNRIFDTDEMNILIEVENKGAYTTKGTADRIYLSGFDPAIITNIPTAGKPIPALEGKSAYTPYGATDRISFSAIPITLSAKNIDKYPVKLLATACYEYQTTASANICIDPNPYKISTAEKACTPQSTTLGSQGAPIAVTSIDLEPSPGITRLQIDITNSGRGEVFKPGLETLQRCSPYSQGLGFEEIDYVRIDEIGIPGKSIINTCKPLDKGHIRLTNNRATIYCQIQTAGQSTYATPLTIQLSYGYKDVIYKNTELISI